MTRRMRLLLSAALVLGLPVMAAWAESSITWGKAVVKTAVQSGTATDSTLWSPDAGNRFLLMGCMFSASNAGTVELEVSDVDVIPPITMASGGTFAVGFGGFPIYESATDAILTYSTSASAGTIRIMCSGWEQP